MAATAMAAEAISGLVSVPESYVQDLQCEDRVFVFNGDWDMSQIVQQHRQCRVFIMFYADMVETLKPKKTPKLIFWGSAWNMNGMESWICAMRDFTWESYDSAKEER